MIKKALMTIGVVLVLNFFLPRMMPGDPFDFISAGEGDVVVTLSQSQIDFYRSYYGMDKSINIQFLDYIKRMITGDLGTSIYYNRPINEMIAERVMWTVCLVVSSLIASFAFGSVLGMYSAYFYKRRSMVDNVLYKLMIILSELPDFIIGISFLFIFAAKFKWFPLSGGATSFAVYESYFEAFKDYAWHAALPFLVLVVISIGDFYLLSRQSMMKVLDSSYVETAKAKGLSKIRIMVHHVFVNAFSPIIARFFMRLGMMLGGAVIVESIFSYPGIGKLMREAVSMRDYVLIQGIFFYVAVLVIIFNMIADLIYKRINIRSVR